MSPKESGEVGETVDDILSRHPDFDGLPGPRVKAIVRRIKQYEEHMTLDLADAVERLVSVAFSLIPGRLQREDAEAALHVTPASLVGPRLAPGLH